MRKLNVVLLLPAMLLLAGCTQAATPNPTTQVPTGTPAPSVSATASANPSSSVPQPTPSVSSSSPSAAPTTLKPTTTSKPVSDNTCTSTNIDVSLSMGNGAAGTEYFDFILKNRGTSTCTLKGFPTVQVVGGTDGHQIGKDASRDTSYGDGSKTVSITPTKNGYGYATLAMPSIYNYELNGQDPSGKNVYSQKFNKQCGSAVKALGYRIYLPGSKVGIYVPQPAFPVCSNPNFAYVRIGTVSKNQGSA